MKVKDGNEIAHQNRTKWVDNCILHYLNKLTCFIEKRDWYIEAVFLDHKRMHQHDFLWFMLVLTLFQQVSGKYPADFRPVSGFCLSHCLDLNWWMLMKQVSMKKDIEMAEAVKSVCSRISLWSKLIFSPPHPPPPRVCLGTSYPLETWRESFFCWTSSSDTRVFVPRATWRIYLTV